MAPSDVQVRVGTDAGALIVGWVRLRRAHAFAAAFAIALSSAAARAAPPPDTLAQRLKPCTTCHARVDPAGRPLNDAYYPRIGGKPAGYLFNQLQNFRDGRRQAPLMAYMVGHLPDAYLLEIATYFAGQHLAAPPAPPSTLPRAALEHGRKLVLHGDPARKVPACVSCHGSELLGVAPAIPGLLGLPHDYVNAQFGAWKNQVRRARQPDCMAAIASRLTVGDVAAISSWLATQPVPPEGRPAQAIARPLPLACGSAPESAQ